VLNAPVAKIKLLPSVALPLLATLAIGLVCCQPVSAQLIINYAEKGAPPEAGLELLQEEAHDIIFFKASAGGGWVKARLLPFPGRKLPASPSGALKFQIIDIENKDFAAKWSDIERIDLWEDRLERETKERIANSDFAGAYPFLSVLIRDFPNRPGLRQIRSDFIWNNAIDYAKKGQRNATLAMLEELRRYAPEYERSKVLRAIDATFNQLLESMVQEGKLDLAQQLLARMGDDYAGERLTSIAKWDAEFLRMATVKRKEAIAARDAKDYRSARQLARESVYLKPDIPGGKELIKEIDTIYPLVNVGVLQTATVFDPTRIDNWASRRSGRLLYRTLFEMKGAGPEGGEYDFIFGETEISPDRINYDLYLEPEKLPAPLNRVNGFFLADMMADRAREETDKYFAPWAAAVQALGLEGPKHVKCFLRRPHVMPNALLQIKVDGSWFGGEADSPTGDYRRDVMEENLTRYVLADKPETPTKPREIVEIRCVSASDAVSKLLNGEVDVLDQLFPADAIRLERSRDVRVSTYPLPSVHMLVPCSDHVYIAERTFRRGLLYGINRNDILTGELLEGQELPGCRVLSGPFPAGLEINDPLGYAYDQTIEPRRFEPSLSQLLVTMTTNSLKSKAMREAVSDVKSEIYAAKVAKKEAGEPIDDSDAALQAEEKRIAEAARKAEEGFPKMKPIRLAFPADNLSRVACEGIRTQWMLIGLEVELVQLPVGRTYPDEGTADLVYTSAAVWEPVIDARRLLGPEGLAGSEDQLVGLGLRRLEEAKNWKEVRDRLLDLHSIAHHELPVLPLWQLVDSYAYRRELQGVGSNIVSLYQNAENWRFQ
jgi:hypothetical protein